MGPGTAPGATRAVAEDAWARQTAALQRLYPTSAYLRRGAANRVPRFVYDFADSGAGDDVGIAHNWAAFDSIKFVPRYGLVEGPPDVRVRILGRDYAAPLGMSPVGGLSVVWPGAERLMAAAAQLRRIPYVLPVAGGASVEEVAAVAPDVAWLQMYRFPNNNHAIGWAILDRAAAAGLHALVLTMDVPTRTTRSREARSGLMSGLKPTPWMAWQIARKPRWVAAILRRGYPRFAMLQAYMAEGAGANDVIAFARREMRGAFTWDEVRRYRDRWKGKLVVKGLLHEQDAEQALAAGVDAVWVSNHGGRQVDALAPSIDCLPAIVEAVKGRAEVFLDSGVRSGHDAARALALGADAAFAGKVFAWSLAAIGDAGPRYALDLLVAELGSCLAQVGARSLAEIRDARMTGQGAWGRSPA